MVTGVILAGGMSSRMGRDKATLPVRSQRLIDLVISHLRPCVDRLMVVGRADNVHEFVDLPVGALVTDIKPGCGPLMGIYTGLMHTETPLNLFVACDMPWVQARLIERLLGACRQDTGVVASLHPVEGVQPFPLVCHVEACRTIGGLLDRGECSVQALLRQPQARLMQIEEPALWRSFVNVNTLADYAKLDHETTLTPRY